MLGLDACGGADLQTHPHTRNVPAVARPVTLDRCLCLAVARAGPSPAMPGSIAKEISVSTVPLSPNAEDSTTVHQCCLPKLPRQPLQNGGSSFM